VVCQVAPAGALAIEVDVRQVMAVGGLAESDGEVGWSTLDRLPGSVPGLPVGQPRPVVRPRTLLPIYSMNHSCAELRPALDFIDLAVSPALLNSKPNRNAAFALPTIDLVTCLSRRWSDTHCLLLPEKAFELRGQSFDELTDAEEFYPVRSPNRWVDIARESLVSRSKPHFEPESPSLAVLCAHLRSDAERTFHDCPNLLRHPACLAASPHVAERH